MVWSKAKASWDPRTEELIKCPSTAIAEAESRWGPPGGHWSSTRLWVGLSPALRGREFLQGRSPCLLEQKYAIGPSCCL